ncbi:MAG: type II secretion system F family protein [Gammaproteobacteria bacterium]
MKQVTLKNQLFIWSGITLQKKRISGEIYALSLTLAKINLQQQGITLINIEKKRKPLLQKLNPKITAFDITIFFRQLATLIAANIPIVQSFEILRQAQDNPKCQTLIQIIKTEIEAGKNLVTGLRKFPQHFDELICHLVHTGEYSGTLAITLHQIADHKEKSLALRKKIKQAIFYPATVFLVAMMVSVTMLTFVVPRFADLFSAMHGHLPAFTSTVIYLSQFIRDKSWLGIFIILPVMYLIYQLKHSPEVKQRIDHLILKVPLIGNIIKKTILARFTRTLATSLAVGLPINEALKIVARTCGNQDFIKAIIALEQSVLAGQQLHSAMQLNALFPALTVQMVKIGEESGMLEHMLKKIAELYETDLDHLLANLSQMLEPLIMIILGVLIGGLVIAMYLPIFKLGTVI